MGTDSYGDCLICLPSIILVEPQRGKARHPVKSEVEEEFAFQLRVRGIPTPERDYRFHPKRRWMFDFAWIPQMIAVEIEGGQWIRGRHSRPAGFAEDCEKYNEATRLGWHLYRFTPAMVTNGQAAGFVEDLHFPRMGQDET